MSKPKILLTSRCQTFGAGIIDEHLNVLKQWYDVIFANKEDLSKDEIIRSIKGASAVLASNRDILDESIVKAAGRKQSDSNQSTLKVICVNGSGYDSVDTAVMKKYGIRVATCGTVNAGPVAEFAITTLLAVCRKLKDIEEAYRSGRAAKETIQPRAGLENSTVGIVGAGRIGQSIARKLVPFDVERIVYYNRSQKPEMENVGAEYCDSLESLAKECDYIIVCLALTKETEKIVDKNVIDLLKPTAIFVNVGRGGLVDQNALVEALQKKRIAGAALDVTTPEPLPPDHPLFKLDNVLLTPHIASDTSEAFVGLSNVMVKNAVAALKNEPMIGELVL